MNLGKLVMAMALMSAILVAGCSSGDSSTKCEGDKDCERGFICIDDKCTARECDNSADCLADQVCAVIPGGDPDKKFCTARECNNTDMPCEDSTMVCQNGLCIPSADTDVIEPGDVPETPSLDNSCKSCSTTQECGDNHLCSPVGSADTKFCLKACTEDIDCKSGYVCFQVTSEAKQCVPVSFKCVDCAGSGCPVGKTCDLINGGCIDVIDTCEKCLQDFECGDGARCYKKAGMSAGVCVPECKDGACADSGKFSCANNDRGIPVCQPRDEGECSPCPQATPYSMSDGTCVECVNTSHCPSGKTCNTTTHVCETTTTCFPPTPSLCEDGECHQCCVDADCTGLVAAGTEKCQDYKCVGADLCGGCQEPTPLCVEIGGNYMCGNCETDLDCIDMDGCKCSQQIPFCVDNIGNVCMPAGATCRTECSEEVACPFFDGMGNALACHPDGYCYSVDGGCNGIDSCCSPGNDCFDLISALMGGLDDGSGMGDIFADMGVEGALMGVCTCKNPTPSFLFTTPSPECPRGEPCFALGGLIATFLNLPPNIARMNVCYDLSELLAGLLSRDD